MEHKPQLPSVMGGADGAVAVIGSKYVRNAVLGAFITNGGGAWVAEWSKRNPANESDFMTKILPKLIVKEVEVNDKRSVEDLLGILDGDFVEVKPSVPSVDSG